MACILCSSLALAVLLACLLTLAPLGHIPFVPFAPGLGGCGEVKGQPSWSLPLNMALFSVLRIEKPQWVQAVLQVATYNHTAGGGGVGCAVCLLGFPVQLLVTDPGPPLPSAAGYGVKHCELFVLHVTVVAAVSKDKANLGESHPVDPSPSSSTGMRLREPSSRRETCGVIGDIACGVMNVFRTGPT